MLSVPNPVEGAALARPEATALVTAAGSLTWRGLFSRAAGLAEGWRGRIDDGEVVALSGPADAAFVAAFHAVGLLGAAAAPMPLRLTAAERARWLDAVRPAQVLQTDGLRLVQPLVSSITAPQWPLEAPRLVLCTSGTTGTPRPVTLTTAQVVFGALGSALRLGHLPDDRWLCCLPLHAAGGSAILLRAALGATSVELQPRFDAQVVADAWAGGRCTLVSLLPSMLGRAIESLGERAVSPRLRAVLVGGAPVPPALVARARAAGLPLALTWGMTETASQICTWFPGAYETAGSGPPLAFARVAADGEGRLTVAGPVAPGGAFETADRGHLDPSGAVRIDGRVDDLLNSDGAKLAPAEVEAALMEHPAVREAVVVARPDAARGARPVAFVILRGALGEEALQAHCRALLTPWKCPERFILLPELPRLATGKPDRRALTSALTDSNGGALAAE